MISAGGDQHRGGARHHPGPEGEPHLRPLGRRREEPDRGDEGDPAHPGRALRRAGPGVTRPASPPASSPGRGGAIEALPRERGLVRRDRGGGFRAQQRRDRRARAARRRPGWSTTTGRATSRRRTSPWSRPPDWVIALDADERCTPALRDAVLAALAAQPAAVGFEVRATPSPGPLDRPRRLVPGLEAARGPPRARALGGRRSARQVSWPDGPTARGDLEHPSYLDPPTTWRASQDHIRAQGSRTCSPGAWRAAPSPWCLRPPARFLEPSCSSGLPRRLAGLRDRRRPPSTSSRST